MHSGPGGGENSEGVVVSETQGNIPHDAAVGATDGVDEVRQRAIDQIERRRKFQRQLFIWAVVMVLLVVAWAQSEYHNAGGWPTEGFSNSSGIPNVWNYWIIYPIIIWAAIMGLRAWTVYRSKPISESEIEREIKRQS